MAGEQAENAMVEPCAGYLGSHGESTSPCWQEGEEGGEGREGGRLPAPPPPAPLSFPFVSGVWAHWSEWVNLDTTCVRGRDVGTDTFQAFQRPLCCHMEASWMIKCSIFKTFSKQNEKNGGREGEDGGDWTRAPAGQDRKCPFIQRSFLPMTHLPALLRTAVYRHNLKHFSLSLSGKWRALSLVSAGNFLSNDIKCKKVLLCPLPSSRIHKALSRENWEW